MNAEDLKYAKTHEWVAVEESDGSTIATIGISKHAVEALTDLVFIDLPQVGAAVSVDEAFCEVESVKAVSDIYSPVAGEVTEVNQPLEENLEWLSDDPYTQGWIAKVKVSDTTGLGALMDYNAYQKMIAEEA